MGGDYRPEPTYAQGTLAAEYAWDSSRDGWSITHLVEGDSWQEDRDSPLRFLGVNAKVGERVVAVNGRRTSKDVSPRMLLLNLGGQEVSVTLADTAGAERTVVVKALKAETPLRYREWVERNRRKVHEATKGRVGYLHVPNMMGLGMSEFFRGYLAEVTREAMVVDVRYNGGGHTSQLILEKLARRRIGYGTSRWGAPQPYPGNAVMGPIVAITNEWAGSDGDIFSHSFKLLKLGTLIGKRTWGGVIGIWPRHRLSDGTVTTQPEFSHWFEDAGWSVENYGTDPHVEIDIAPQDWKAGRDTQLDHAIAIVLEKMAESPPKLPDFPKRPTLTLPTLPTRGGGKG
jgi:tricorn protease